MNKVLLVLTAFSLGYVVQDIAKEYNLDPISEARAEVAGMNQYALENDHDFVWAVRRIVHKYCSGDGLCY